MNRCEGNYLYLDPVVVGVGDDNVILELLNFVFSSSPTVRQKSSSTILIQKKQF